LRALTLAAQHPTERHIRVPVTSTDEIGMLTAAFNDMSERREFAEQQRKTLVSDVAHELGTPLTNIRSWLEAAQDGVAQPDAELMTLLLEEAVLLQHIIDDLRDLAAADVGSLRVYPEQVFVNDLLDQVAAAHHGRAEAVGVRLTVETDGDPELAVDPARLRQMVGNLASNAIHYSAPGGTVTIRSRVTAGQLVVDVSDTGTGIDSKDLPHVFDRFWRADKSRTRHTGGSGLGLAIVRQLTEAHGGTIGVTSVPGAGTVFTLRLPVDQQ
jgi:signal transduction histidine kinase